MGNIYDGAFRTIVNDCRKLIIPVINEVFGEEYTGEERIEFFPNEHFVNQQDTANKERITDTSFAILGKVRKTYHIECESSLPDGRMTIRLFEYDAQIALDEGEVIEEILTVTFPHTAVLYLRTYNKTPDKINFHMRSVFLSIIITSRSWKDSKQNIRTFLQGLTIWNSEESSEHLTRGQS